MADLHHETPPFIVSKIAIIGAGVSGISAAKQLSHHNSVVFEASDSIGGVWKSCAYNSTKLQSARKDYEFSDFPWPNRDDPSFPTHVEIVDYSESYAKHFDVLKFVEFNSKVMELRFFGHHESLELAANAGAYVSPLPGHPVWQIAVRRNNSENLHWYAFEFVVVLHSLDYCKLDKDAATQLLKGKKVAVIGYKKSAIDLAVECAEENQGPEGQPCTMVVRTLHWTVPHYWVWVCLSSCSTQQDLLSSSMKGLTKAFSGPCSATSYLPWRGVSKFVESYLLWKLPLQKYGLKPDHPFEKDYASCQMAIMPENFFTEADKGNIADVVILATGYDGKKKLKTILPDPFCSLIEYHPSGITPLYRGTIHPLIPNMAFVGYIESVANLHTYIRKCRCRGEQLGSTRGTAFRRLASITVMKSVKKWDGILGGREAGLQKHLALMAVRIIFTKIKMFTESIPFSY
ncbi:putative flavin-containing monooxygenase 1 [Hibiscus syriacus]|uniref:Flavin-containing monooxygenase n=1 Tax=Hibiscus syriacus TaxID=106335 RepID=A0A6A2YT03_HIBSY|nr:putative flavin-containing monooxygenase 1 [Hibiscus syriacus]